MNKGSCSNVICFVGCSCTIIFQDTKTIRISIHFDGRFRCLFSNNREKKIEKKKMRIREESRVKKRAHV